MTLNDLTAVAVSVFLRFFEPNFLKVYMYETDLCPISELLVAVLIAVKLGCCRLRDVDVVTIFYLFNPHNFFVTVTNV